MATIASSSGTSDGDDGAEDDQQHDQRRREAEEELALLQILVREREQVVVRGVLARDRHLVRAVVGALDDGDHVLDPVLGVVAHPDRQHRRVAIARDEARVARAVRGRHPVGAAGRLQRRGELLDRSAHVRVLRHVLAGCPEDDDLVDEVVRRTGMPADRRVALLRLRVVRDVGVGRDRRRKQTRDRRDRENEDRCPDRRPSASGAAPRAGRAARSWPHANDPHGGRAIASIW